MSALDKINDLIVRIQSGDEEFIAIFEEGFKKFEEEYDKESMMGQVEEMVDKLCIKRLDHDQFKRYS